MNRKGALLGAPLTFLFFLLCLFWGAGVAVNQFYEDVFLPYTTGGLVIFYDYRVFFVVVFGVPFSALILPFPVITFLKYGIRVDLSSFDYLIQRYTQFFFRFVAIWMVVVLILSLVFSAVMIKLFESRGYSYCHKVVKQGDQQRLIRRYSGYVKNPMLCFP